MISWNTFFDTLYRIFLGILTSSWGKWHLFYYFLFENIIKKERMSRKRSEKENISDNIQKIFYRHGKSLEKSQETRSIFTIEKKGEPYKNTPQSERIVDEVTKPVRVHPKKKNKHIGQEAFLPISLEILKKTLNQCIRHPVQDK